MTITLFRCLFLSSMVVGAQAFSITPHNHRHHDVFVLLFLSSSPSPSPSIIQRCGALYASSNDNTNSFASISSDGVVSGTPRRSTGSLGKPSKKKKQKQPNSKGNKPPIMSKKDRQRTANGTIQSDNNGNNNAVGVDPAEQQGIQVVRGSRGNKTVTIVRGMNATPVDQKKKILKLLKSKLGVGGTLVEGVLEVQGGTHADKVVEILKGLGYAKARKVGK